MYSVSTAPKTKIFVGRIPETCTEDELRVLFGTYGSVVECDIVKNYGFVHMSTPEEAQAAISALNNYSFKGSYLKVEPSTSSSRPRTRAAWGATHDGSSYMTPRPSYPDSYGYQAAPPAAQPTEADPYGSYQPMARYHPGPYGERHPPPPVGYERRPWQEAPPGPNYPMHHRQSYENAYDRYNPYDVTAYPARF